VTVTRPSARTTAAALLLGALTIAALLPGPAAVAGKPGVWTKIGADVESNNVAPTVVRTGDGVLHIAWQDDAGSNQVYRYLRIRKDGSAIGTPTSLLPTAWAGLHAAPKLIRDGAGVRLIFSGLRQIGSGDYDLGVVYTATAPEDGSPWDLVNGSMSHDNHAYTASGLSGTLRNGNPFAGFTFSDTVFWHNGVDNAFPAASDETFTVSGGVLYDFSMATEKASQDIWGAWYNLQMPKNGIWAMKLEPSRGAPTRAPGSIDNSGDSLLPGQDVALTGRIGDKGVYAAYCSGYPTCNSIKLWKVGANGASSVPGSAGVDVIAIAPGPNGRLWIIWHENGVNKLFAVRTNKAATKFGAVRSIGLPSGTIDVYAIAAEGSTSLVDVVINASTISASNVWHTQIQPGLALLASPVKFDNAAAHTVTFTVKDAGAPVQGAKVTIAGKSDRTNADGIAKISFPKGFHTGTYKATARKAGYWPDTVRIKVV
jgi:hypothetical protein